ncbi:Membrane-associated lipoprotein [Frankliniella fusca]|uniref:Membrane-associated lipoprotein n=1 Tax=Frankliniella fusca TaxID=407009 RepID=A0AAE1LG74_9NEOP|nr:Membrane-associated lipoprotein [Frankliniella fusca]
MDRTASVLVLALILPALLLLPVPPALPAVLRCAQVERQASPVFHLVRRCSRSAMSVVAQANVTSRGRCADLAASRRGLAFNYSPRDAPRGDGQFSSSCLVLDCPEFHELSALQRDEAYDYYSLFTDPMREYDLRPRGEGREDHNVNAHTSKMRDIHTRSNVQHSRPH